MSFPLFSMAFHNYIPPDLGLMMNYSIFNNNCKDRCFLESGISVFTKHFLYDFIRFTAGAYNKIYHFGKFC